MTCSALLHLQSQVLQLYCISCPTPTVIDRCLQSPSANSRHETYASPSPLSRPPSHESFVAEVEVAGAVRPLSERQEEPNALAVFPHTCGHANARRAASFRLTGTALRHPRPSPDPSQPPSECVSCRRLPTLPVDRGASPSLSTHPHFR